MLETDANDNLSVRYVRGINYISRVDAADKPSYFLFNGHGDVVHTVSKSGDIENQYDYDIFGNPILTIEVYASAIRYAGEFYDVEAGLYYLRARYYDPYIGRFISADTYWGEDNSPLSLNLYTYTHNDPINFWDPTGHWEQGDEDLNVEAQAKIISLTTAYYSADTKAEREAIQAQARAIRDDEKNKQAVVTPLEFNKGSIQNINNKLKNSSTGYFSGDDWNSTLKKEGIQTNVERHQTEATDLYTVTTGLTATTTIGRTNLSVELENTHSYNTNTATTKDSASANLKLSYNVNANEAKFVQSMASEDTTLEQVLYVLDTLERSDGKLSKSDLKNAGLEYHSGLLWTSVGDNLSTIEAAYDLSTKGYSVVEGEIEYQKELSAKFQEGLSVWALGAAGGGFRISTARRSDIASTEITATRANKTSKTTAETSNGYKRSSEQKLKIDGCQCFTAGTKVQTEAGEKNIEDIEVGDKVLSKDEETGEVAYKEVTATFNHETGTDEIYKIHVGDQVIESTFNHPFWVDGKGWTFVKDLKPGDLLVQSDGHTLKIESIELEHEKATVYNMTVDEFHTYFVSDLGFWVHNTDNENCRVYYASPKHDPKTGWGSPNPIPNNEVGQKLLDGAYSSSKNKQLYNVYEGKLVKFQPDSNGSWHPYAVANPAKEVPTDVLRQMLNDGLITKTEYNKFLKNN
ncbi:polymorphic toxin-type HINT domain-containing protein [Paenibacillus sp. HB172176]|uniref:polymorphic toxin-type HINT domain-containing protein n=1 Tax=Paenibacillus sp. HB172176 TaxID=2493690 RepID=UPI003211CFD9